jgi:hypothetical protein
MRGRPPRVPRSRSLTDPRSSAIVSITVAEEQIQAPVHPPETDGGAAERPELPDPGTCRELLQTMALIRRFEEEAGRQYQRAKIGGFLHLAAE